MTEPDSALSAEPDKPEALPSDLEQIMLAHLRELQAQITEARQQMELLQEPIDAATKEGQAWREAALLANPDLAGLAEIEFFAGPAGGRRRRHKPGAPRVAHNQMVEWLLEIFAASGKQELQVRDILSEIENNPRYTLPGAGTTANISVHLGGSPLFEQAADRGAWRLAQS